MSITRNRTISHHRHHASTSNGSQAGSLLTRAADQTAAQIKGIKTRVSDGIAVAKVSVGKAAKAVKKGAVRTDKVIRAKPYHAIAIASGAALLTGYVIGRRRSS
jgi:ElaB/YqjD/DUF883 family membrane-anchored ribosome-binding protein